jgi:WD40 repeat protein
VGEISGISKTLTTADFRPIKPFTLALSGEEFTVGFFAGPPFKFKSTQKHHTSFVNCLRYSPDGAYFMTVSSDRSMQLHNGETGELIRTFKKDGHQGGITFLDFFKSKNFFATSSLDKTVRIWDFTTEGDHLKELILS